MLRTEEVLAVFDAVGDRNADGLGVYFIQWSDLFCENLFT